MRFFVGFIFSALFIHCSSKPIVKQNVDTEDALYWSETRKLSWDDFQGQPILGTGAIVSEIVVKNPTNFERKGLFGKSNCQAHCYVDKKNSWVDRKNAKDELLLYNQTIFDIYELYTRQLRQTFASTSFGLKDPIKIFNHVVEKNNEQLFARLKAFRTETGMGQKFETVKSWSAQISAELRALEAFK